VKCLSKSNDLHRYSQSKLW